MDVPNDPESPFVTKLPRHGSPRKRSKPAMSTSAAISGRCLRPQLGDLLGDLRLPGRKERAAW